LTISPLDVRSQVFRKKLRGYDPDEVRHFLEAVADCMEGLIKESEDLRRDLGEVREKADSYARIETALRDSMLAAQRMSEDARASAEKEADNIIRSADLDAQRRITEALRRADDITRMRETARAQTIAMVTKLRSLLDAHLGFLSDIENEARALVAQPIMGGEDMGDRAGGPPEGRPGSFGTTDAEVTAEGARTSEVAQGGEGEAHGEGEGAQEGDQPAEAMVRNEGEGQPT
jgi:cell division initiation protein